jgi:hypothetical protein
MIKTIFLFFFVFIIVTYWKIFWNLTKYENIILVLKDIFMDKSNKQYSVI